MNFPSINQRGFTLLEVIVALAVLAIALAAIIKASSEYAENLSYLRDRTLAHWVAMNVLTEVRLYQSWPPVGEQQGQMLMAERRWFWQLTVSETVDEALRRLAVKVRDQEQAKEPLAVLVGFVGQPALSSRSHRQTVSFLTSFSKHSRMKSQNILE